MNCLQVIIFLNSIFLGPYLLCIKHAVYIFSLNYLCAHKTTNLTSFMVEENGNNCLPQLATCIVIPKCNSINNNDDGAANQTSSATSGKATWSLHGVSVSKGSVSHSSFFHSIRSLPVLSLWDLNLYKMGHLGDRIEETGSNSCREIVQQSEINRFLA